ncbi:MAG: zeta toxin family protein [Planctomycetes bacterium]|nr:zeta toxin family protein [Planctomycetota bacterium]
MLAPRALILAGPNGAGKTTFAREFLPGEGHCLAYINADLIAAGLAPFTPQLAAVRAARLMAEAIAAVTAERQDFAVETTMAGRSYVGLIRDWQQAGYRVKCIFLRLPTVELAIERVRVRVEQGGHHIPEDVIRRRFDRGWQNFLQLYRPLVDAWQVYDASDAEHRLLEQGSSP